MAGRSITSSRLQPEARMILQTSNRFSGETTVRKATPPVRSGTAPRGLQAAAYNDGVNRSAKRRRRLVPVARCAPPAPGYADRLASRNKASLRRADLVLDFRPPNGCPLSLGHGSLTRSPRLRRQDPQGRSVRALDRETGAWTIRTLLWSLTLTWARPGSRSGHWAVAGLPQTASEPWRS
jgi:hypothetical protein